MELPPTKEATAVNDQEDAAAAPLLLKHATPRHCRNTPFIYGADILCGDSNVLPWTHTRPFSCEGQGLC